MEDGPDFRSSVMILRNIKGFRGGGVGFFKVGIFKGIGSPRGELTISSLVEGLLDVDFDFGRSGFLLVVWKKVLLTGFLPFRGR